MTTPPCECASRSTSLPGSRRCCIAQLLGEPPGGLDERRVRRVLRVRAAVRSVREVRDLVGAVAEGVDREADGAAVRLRRAVDPGDDHHAVAPNPRCRRRRVPTRRSGGARRDRRARLGRSRHRGSHRAPRPVARRRGRPRRRSRRRPCVPTSPAAPSDGGGAVTHTLDETVEQTRAAPARPCTRTARRSARGARPP